MGAPRNPVIDPPLAEMLDKPHPIRGKRHDGVKEVEEPGQPSKIRIPRVNPPAPTRQPGPIAWQVSTRSDEIRR